jgi:transposase InsO family protein
VQKEFGVSERRACRVTGQQRATQRYQRRIVSDEAQLVKEMRVHAAKHPRFGSPRILSLLTTHGWRVNHKRVERLWRLEGLKVPQRQRKRRRLGHSANSCTRRKAERRNHVWTYDFVMDRTEDGKRLKLLTIVDEYTRECLAVDVARHITGTAVIDTLNRLIRERGAPGHVRSDNGPEFIAHAVRTWLTSEHVDTLFIAPGSPWENAYCESFNGKLQDELLKGELFTSLVEARWLVDRWRHEYNHDRPHSSLGYETPARFAARCGTYGADARRPFQSREADQDPDQGKLSERVDQRAG